MVVMPAFAAGENGYPPVVAGVVFGLEAALSPEVSGRVDEPGGVETDSDAEEGSPEEHADCTNDVMACWCEGCTKGELKKTSDYQRDVVVLA